MWVSLGRGEFRALIFGDLPLCFILIGSMIINVQFGVEVEPTVNQ
jgi:hypothetical protein